MKTTTEENFAKLSAADRALVIKLRSVIQQADFNPEDDEEARDTRESYKWSMDNHAVDGIIQTPLSRQYSLELLMRRVPMDLWLKMIETAEPLCVNAHERHAD